MNKIDDKKWLLKLHKEEQGILDELDRICKKNGIKYFLTGGTLIGAVRHKGFIPWDDDIDLGMTRNDFEKFLKVCKRELNDNYYLDYYKINKHNPKLYAKLKRKDTLFIENSIKNVKKLDNGIWIDIFPYDNIEEFNSENHIAKNNFRINVEKLAGLKCGIKSYLSEYRKEHKLKMLFIDSFLKVCPLKILLGIAEKKLSSDNNDNSKYLSNMTGGLELSKETHLRTDIFPLVKLEFEGKKYYCPKEYNKILTKVYGDYMKLPPIDKQVTHNPTKVKFSDGETIEFKGDDM